MISAPHEKVPSKDDQDFILGIYQDHIQQMASVCNRYISSPDDREDVIQEVLLALMKKTSILRTLSPQALFAYVHVTVRNTAINFLRKQAADQKLIEQLEQLYPVEDTLGTDGTFLTFWNRTQLRMIWSKLSRNERLLLGGRYIFGYSDAELAALLQCKASSIRMMISRARHRAVELFCEQEL